ncbi:MAG: hypothetical protein ACE14S_00830 [Candidatus Bathyarchaeia archaeon]
MQQLILNLFVTLHAGTSPVLSQTVLTLMFVVLGVLLVGIGFGYVVKNKEALRQHRFALTTVLILTLIPTAAVMIPTMIRFYTDPDVMVYSSISLTQMVHAAVSIPALATAVIYAFGKLPGNVKKGMRWTAALWIASMVLGVLIFLQMMDLIPTF